MSLSKLINSSENRYDIRRYTLPMDEKSLPDVSDLSVSSEEIVKTKTKKRLKKPNPKWYNYLLLCLENDCHNHMLSYVPGSNKEEFSVVFTDKKNKKKWRSMDISLFKDLDKHIGNAFNRKRLKEKYEEDVKIRFKSNMCKCLKQGYIVQIGEEKIERYKTVKKYKILWRPAVSVGQSGNDGRIGRNKGKSYRKSYKKDNNKETKLSRRNFQTKTANSESIPQIGSNEIMDFESMSKEDDDKNEIVGNNLESLENLDFKDLSQEDKMHFENVCFEVNSVAIPQYVFEGKHENYSHFLCPSNNSQIKIDESEHVSSGVNLRNLEISCPAGHFMFDNDIKIDGSEHVNSGVSLGNLKNSSPANYFMFENDPNIYELSKDGLVKILNSDTNLSGNSMEGRNLNVINDDGFENQGNQCMWNNGKYIVDEDEYLKERERINLESDPFMSRGQFLTDFSPLGASDDWSCSYQPLKNMEAN